MRRHWMDEAWNWRKTFLFCLPALGMFTVFFLLPAAFSLYYGFFQWNGLDPEMTYVGFRNFLELFTDAGFWSSLLITIKVVVASILLQSGLALLVATICVGARKGMKFFCSALFVPQVLSLAAVGAAWVLIYDPYYGVLNRLIESLGFERVRISRLGTPQLALPSMIATTTWAYFGFHMVLYLAAIAAIPAEIYDAVKFETTSPPEGVLLGHAAVIAGNPPGFVGVHFHRHVWIPGGVVLGDDPGRIFAEYGIARFVHVSPDLCG